MSKRRRVHTVEEEKLTLQATIEKLQGEMVILCAEDTNLPG
jgi:hypothetical protein